MIISNPFTGETLVLNHPGHPDQSVHGGKRQSLRDRFEKPIGGGYRSVRDILVPLGFEENYDEEGPNYTSSLGTSGKRVKVVGSREDEYTPNEVSIDFEDAELGYSGANKKLAPGNLKFLRKLRGLAAILDREGIRVTGSPSDTKRARIYDKTLKSIGVPPQENPFSPKYDPPPSDPNINPLLDDFLRA